MIVIGDIVSMTIISVDDVHDVFMRIVALCLPFVTEIWQVYILIFVLQSASAAFTPTFQATISDILPEEDRYTQALSISRLAYDLENLISPTLAAILRKNRIHYPRLTVGERLLRELQRPFPG